MIGIIITNTIRASTSASTLAEIAVLGLLSEVKMLTLLLPCTHHQVIENTEVSLFEWHGCHSDSSQAT